MLAEIIPKLAAEGQRKESKFYPRPSLAGPDRCIRQMVYWALGFQKKPFPGRTLIVFEDGNWHEELTLDWLRKSSFQVHSEQMEVTCRPPMKKGHIDGIITDITIIDRLLEHKGLNHFSFERYWSGEIPSDYLTQTAIYIDGLQKINPDLKQGILLIKNKNTSAYMEFLVEFDGENLAIIDKTRSDGSHEKVNLTISNIVNDACEKFNSVLDYAAKNTLPKRPYDIEDWHCQYCGWAETCWDNYEQEFKELKTAAELPDEIADKVRYYRELGGHMKDMKKEQDDLKKLIKDTMKAADAREGRAGEYLIKLSLVESNRIDKSLLNAAEIEKATKKSFYEKLSIRKGKA